ncbi:hypothetical protein EVAR_22655_1 [Eumeta japonica]|uniref:Uncharacterized protein n=1 Tax=Eumeta variegata TaxID=151549 RepID=A0A4C1VKT4_EUMVA|nr:hypothetical protein EVAR_22655_1 [Eumeta japonica]
MFIEDGIYTTSDKPTSVDIRRPTSAPNGRATAPTPRPPPFGVAPCAVHASDTAARRSVAAYRIAFASLAALYRLSAIRPGPCAVWSSRREIPRGAAGAFSQGRALSQWIATGKESHRTRDLKIPPSLARATQPRPRDGTSPKDFAAARPSSLPPIPTPVRDDSDRSEDRRSRPKPQPYHGSGRWIHLLPDHPKSKQCDSKGIVILNGRNPSKALKSVRHGRSATLKYHPKEEREFRVVLRGVPKKTVNSGPPVQSVRRITNRARERPSRALRKGRPRHRMHKDTIPLIRPANSAAAPR